METFFRVKGTEIEAEKLPRNLYCTWLSLRRLGRYNWWTLQETREQGNKLYNSSSSLTVATNLKELVNLSFVETMNMVFK